DPRALIFVPVPRAVLGDQDRVLVLGGELTAGIELHAERSDVGAEVDHRRSGLGAFVGQGHFWMRQILLVAIWVAEMLTEVGDHMELVARQIVADPVAGVLGEPVSAGARVDIAADRVAYAERHEFGIAGLRIDATDLGEAGRRKADVEGRSERNVEPA